jgi:hypothetical protein
MDTVGFVGNAPNPNRRRSNLFVLSDYDIPVRLDNTIKLTRPSSMSQISFTLVRSARNRNTESTGFLFE